METIFHSLQYAPAFFRTRMVVQEKAIKHLSDSLQTNALALTLENIKGSKKRCAHSEIRTGDLEITILDWTAVGSSGLRLLTGSLH